MDKRVLALSIVVLLLAVLVYASGLYVSENGMLFLDQLFNILNVIANAIREGFIKLISYLVNAFLYVFTFMFMMATYVALLGLKTIAQLFSWLLDIFITMLLWTPLINAGFAPGFWGATGDCTGGLDQYWGVEKFTLDQPAFSSTLGVFWNVSVMFALTMLTIATIMALALNRMKQPISNVITSAVGILFSADIYNFLAILSLAIARIFYEIFMIRLGGLTGFWNAITLVYDAFIYASITNGPLNVQNWPWGDVNASIAFTGASLFLLLVSVFAIFATLITVVYVAMTIILTVIGRIFGFVLGITFLPISKAFTTIKSLLAIGREGRQKEVRGTGEAIGIGGLSLSGMVSEFIHSIINFFSGVEKEIVGLLRQNIIIGVLFGLLGIFTILGLLMLGGVVTTTITELNENIHAYPPGLVGVESTVEFDYGCKVEEKTVRTFLLNMTFVIPTESGSIRYSSVKKEGTEYRYDPDALRQVFSAAIGAVSISGGENMWSWSNNANTYMQFSISLAIVLLLFGMGQMLIIRNFITTSGRTDFTVGKLIESMKNISSQIFMAGIFTVGAIGGLAFGYLGGALARGLSALGARAAMAGATRTGLFGKLLTMTGRGLTGAGLAVGTTSTRLWKTLAGKSIKTFEETVGQVKELAGKREIEEAIRKFGLTEEYARLKKKWGEYKERMKGKLFSLIEKLSGENKLRSYLESKYELAKNVGDKVSRLNLIEKVGKIGILEEKMRKGNIIQRFLARNRYNVLRKEAIKTLITDEDMEKATEEARRVYERYRDVLGEDEARRIAEQTRLQVLWNTARRRAEEISARAGEYRRVLHGLDAITRLDKMLRRVEKRPNKAEKYVNAVEDISKAVGYTAEKAVKEIEQLEPKEPVDYVGRLASISEKYGLHETSKKLRDLIARGRDAVIAEAKKRGIMELAKEKGVTGKSLGEILSKLREMGIEDKDIIARGLESIRGDVIADFIRRKKLVEEKAKMYKDVIGRRDYVAAEKILRELKSTVGGLKNTAKNEFREVANRLAEIYDGGVRRHSIDEEVAKMSEYAEVYRRIREFAPTRPEDVFEGKASVDELAKYAGYGVDFLGYAAPAVYAAAYAKTRDVDMLLRSVEAEADRVYAEKQARGESVEPREVYEEVLKRYAKHTRDIEALALVPEAKFFADKTLPVVIGKAKNATGDNAFEDVYNAWLSGDISSEEAARKLTELAYKYVDTLPSDVYKALTLLELPLLLTAAKIDAPPHLVAAAKRVTGRKAEATSVSANIVPRVDRAVRRGGISVTGKSIVPGDRVREAKPKTREIRVGEGRGGVVAVSADDVVVSDVDENELTRSGWRIERRVEVNAVPVVLARRGRLVRAYVKPVRVEGRRVKRVEEALSSKENSVIVSKKPERIVEELEKHGAKIVRGENGYVAVLPDGRKVFVVRSANVREIRPVVEKSEPVRETIRVHIPVVFERELPAEIVVGRGEHGVGIMGHGPVEVIGEDPDKVPGEKVAETRVGPVPVVVKHGDNKVYVAVGGVRAPEKGRRARSLKQVERLAKTTDVIVLPKPKKPEDRRRILEEAVKRVGGKPVFFGEDAVYIEKNGRKIWLLYPDALGKYLKPEIEEKVREELDRVVTKIPMRSGYVSESGELVVEHVDPTRLGEVAEKYAKIGDVYAHDNVVEVVVPPEEYGKIAEASIRDPNTLVEADRIVRLEEGVPVVIRPKGVARVEEIGTDDTAAAIAAIAGELKAPTMAGVRKGVVKAWRPSDARVDELLESDKIVVNKKVFEDERGRRKLDELLRRVTEKGRPVKIVYVEPRDNKYYVKEVTVMPTHITGVGEPLEIVEKMIAATPEIVIDARDFIEASEIPVNPRTIAVVEAVSRIDPSLRAPLMNAIRSGENPLKVLKTLRSVIEVERGGDVNEIVSDLLRKLRLHEGEKVFIVADEDVGDVVEPILKSYGITDSVKINVNGKSVVVYHGTVEKPKKSQQQSGQQLQQEQRGQQHRGGSKDMTRSIKRRKR